MVKKTKKTVVGLVDELLDDAMRDYPDLGGWAVVVTDSEGVVHPVVRYDWDIAAKVFILVIE